MKFHWGTWDPSYSRPTPSDDAADTTANIEVDVEVPARSWTARGVRADVAPPDAVLFVDGVLRVDARGWGVDETGAAHAILAASYAAGVVRCDLAAGVASLVAARVERALLTTAEEPYIDREEFGSGAYRRYGVPGVGHKPLDGKVVGLMSTLELNLSAQARHSPERIDDHDLLVLDGRLRGRRVSPRTIGYVKTQATQYLPPELRAVVTTLPANTRTPVFGLDSLYSWYLRLPGPAAGPWEGIVRLECSGELERDEAVALADLSLSTLPRFASRPYKDARAPQNLVPIGGLERRLRGLLGDARLLHRTLVRSAG